MSSATAQSLATLIPMSCFGVVLLHTPVPFLSLGFAGVAVVILATMGLDSNGWMRFCMTVLRTALVAAIVAIPYYSNAANNSDVYGTQIKAGHYALSELKAEKSARIYSHESSAVVNLPRDNMSLEEIAAEIRNQLGYRTSIAPPCPSGWTIWRGYDNAPDLIVGGP